MEAHTKPVLHYRAGCHRIIYSSRGTGPYRAEEQDMELTNSYSANEVKVLLEVARIASVYKSHGWSCEDDQMVLAAKAARRKFPEAAELMDNLVNEVNAGVEGGIAGDAELIALGY